MTARQKLDNIQILLRESNFHCQHNSVWFLTDGIVCENVEMDYRFIYRGSHSVNYIEVELSKSSDFSKPSTTEEVIIQGLLESDIVYNQIVSFLKNLSRAKKLEELV